MEEGVATMLNEPVYAGFFRRMLGSLIDAAVVGTVGAVVNAPFGVPKTAGAPVSSVQAVVTIVFGLASFLYYVGMESSAKQATIGKILMGLKVTDLNGNRIGFLRSTGRYCCHLFSVLTLGVGFLMVFFTKKKQTLHDKIAGCLVIRI